METNFVEKLPEKFKKIVLAMPHFDGEKWLENLPLIICEIEDKWSLKVEDHFSNLSYNYVAPCVLSNGTEAVLKIGMPEEDSELFDEAKALKFFDGNGMAKLLNIDYELEVLLLEKIKPGKNAKEVFADDKIKAVETAIELLEKILIKPPEDAEFPFIDKWFNDFERKRNVVTMKEFDKASELLRELNADNDQRFLLHGDFHHDNILSSERAKFLAIDPVGIIGNIGYEIAVFLNEHAIWIKNEPDFNNKLKTAVNRFSESFGLSSEFIRKWAWTQRVLGAWWDFEDNIGNWREYLAFAEIWE